MSRQKLKKIYDFCFTTGIPRVKEKIVFIRFLQSRCLFRYANWNESRSGLILSENDTLKKKHFQ